LSPTLSVIGFFALIRKGLGWTGPHPAFETVGGMNVEKKRGINKDAEI
jgi:hypothetical protein